VSYLAGDPGSTLYDTVGVDVTGVEAQRGAGPPQETAHRLVAYEALLTQTTPERALWWEGEMEEGVGARQKGSEEGDREKDTERQSCISFK
jgi:hypothetical protein